MILRTSLTQAKENKRRKVLDIISSQNTSVLTKLSYKKQPYFTIPFLDPNRNIPLSPLVSNWGYLKIPIGGVRKEKLQDILQEHEDAFLKKHYNTF